MNIYKSILSLSILLLSLSASAQDILDRYLLTAAENNPGLITRFNEYLAALEVAPQVKALPDPQVAFGYFIQPVETRVGPQEFRISASQMFPWFGTLKTQENVAIQTAKAKYEAFEEAKSKLFNEVRGTYYNLYFNWKAIEIVKENIQILNTFQKLALIKVEAGMVSPVDEYRIEMEIGDLENQLALLKDQQFSLEVAFFNLLNSEHETVILPDTLWDQGPGLSKQDLLDSILIQNHQLLGLELQREALMFREELARKQGKPDFSVGLDYIIVGKGDNNLSGKDAFMFPKIGITIPLYRNKYKAMVNEVTYLETAKMNEKLDRENMIETLFENTWKEFLDADRRIELYNSQLNLAEKSIQLLETEYSTANKDFEEILRMERKKLFYALELERARADKQAAVSFVKYLMGS
ncbi:MAG: TolC family protein [Bacteroidales bacterium]|nr:TolC family protein [Bacteroidales bacterium]